MTEPYSNSEDRSAGGAAFRTTHWSVVLAASDREAPAAMEALERLCRAYRYPVYAYIRRRGHGPDDAEDLVQEFFARFLDKNYLNGITREGGRFRSFLLTTVKHFLANQWERGQAQKRGGGKAIFSLDEEDPESRYKFEPADNMTPERLFERRWALAVLEQALSQVRAEYLAEGKAALFDCLQPFLSGDKSTIGYQGIGAGLGMSEGAVKVAVHRLRKRYGQMLRAEIEQTVASPEEVADEIRYLIRAAAG